MLKMMTVGVIEKANEYELSEKKTVQDVIVEMNKKVDRKDKVKHSETIFLHVKTIVGREIVTTDDERVRRGG